MRTWTRRASLVALLAAIAAIAVPSGGGAFTGGPLWKCRASAVYASFAGNNRVEPIVANGNPNTANGTNPDRAQCVPQDVGAENLTSTLGIPESAVTAKTAQASTRIDPELGLAIDQKISATARVENLSLPLGSSTVVLGVAAANSTVNGSCVNGKPQITGTSQLTGLTLGGQTLSADQLVDALSKALAPLGPIVDIKVNEQVHTGNALTVRALHVKVLSAAGTNPLLDVIVAEAKGDRTDDVCDPTKQIPGNPGAGSKPCPEGAKYDAVRNICYIAASSAGPEIVIGPPFQGPSGGRVVRLTTARKNYKSPCLTGPGPKYAVIGTKKNDRITGTNGSDRILGLGGNDALDGGRGNDCLDGGTGSDNVNGAIGDDRAYGMSGNDHLNGGPGNDRLSAGSGNDTVNAGYGADRVFAGSGNDAVNVATAGRKAHVDCGAGYDKVRYNNEEKRFIRGCEVLYGLVDRQG